MNTYNNCPIFLLNVDDDDSTITTISLVDAPAMELPMYCFGEEKELIKFSIDETKHNIISCIVRTNYPIIRVDAEGNPYYVVFTKETSEALCQKLMTDGYLQNISLNHDGNLIAGIQLQEVFLKDSSKGINPVGFEAADEYSLFGIFHVTDEQLWNDCLEGKFGGVSLESYFKLEQFNKIKPIKNKNNFHMKLKERIRKILLEFGSIETNKGVLDYEGETLEIGTEVFVNDEPAADGEYETDNKIYVVAEGKIVEIREKEAPAAEEAPAVETPAVENMEEETPATEEPAVEEPEVVAEVKSLEERVTDLEFIVEELAKKIADISMEPASEPIVEEFAKAVKPQSTGTKQDKYIAMFQNCRK